MNSVQHYHKLKGDTLFRKFVRKLAFRAGYVCVPAEYPLWLTKSATSHEIAAKCWDNENKYNAGQHNGMATAYNEVAETVSEFGKL